MKLNMAVIDQRPTEIPEVLKSVTFRKYNLAQEEADRMVDEAIRSVLASMAVAEIKPMKIDWGTAAYNAQSYDEKKRRLELEGLKTMGAFL